MVTPQFLTDVRRARRTELQSLLIIALYELANEDHACTATRAERKRPEHSWVLKLNTQSPLVPSGYDQITQEFCDDFKNFEVKMEMKSRKLIHISKYDSVLIIRSCGEMKL